MGICPFEKIVQKSLDRGLGKNLSSKRFAPVNQQFIIVDFNLFGRIILKADVQVNVA